ncbi:MAG TPA: hypothetical protein VNB22_12305 [Pyrinomonadaceae bacterium]|nr:hypothetical protein [Pyrinomonadaceae bacterium]
MNLKQTQLHILHEAENLAPKAKTGVSLHCHTEHSKEMLDFIPHYAEKLPIISFFWKMERDKYLKREGKGIDFSTAYWSPPMSPHDVYRIEKEQINNAGLEAMVSISDHDSIDGNLKINEQLDNKKAPISLEWTVPFEYGFFHVGVHNLPKESAVELTKTLVDFTFSENPSNERLHELFAMLNEIPQILVILNHPLWDIEIVGKEKHELLLKHFIKEHGRWIHALEINGFRAWSENKAVIEMAEALGMPIVTGGDRHGCKPNTVINLTKSGSFEEFVEEIRVDKRSEVVLMPEYKQPLHSRQLQSFSEILRNYPEFPEERRRWFDRVHFDLGKGEGLNPLSAYGWVNGGPLWLRWAIKTLGFFGSPKMRPFFAVARKKYDRVPKDAAVTNFEIPNLEEIAPKSLSSDAV